MDCAGTPRLDDGSRNGTERRRSAARIRRADNHRYPWPVGRLRSGFHRRQHPGYREVLHDRTGHGLPRTWQRTVRCRRSRATEEWPASLGSATSTAMARPTSRSVGPEDVMACSSEMGVMFGNGNGKFQAYRAVGQLPWETNPAVGDFDGDGRSDLGGAGLYHCGETNITWHRLPLGAGRRRFRPDGMGDGPRAHAHQSCAVRRGRHRRREAGSGVERNHRASSS